MRLPLIKDIVSFIETNDQDYVIETVAVLEYLTESTAITDEELDTIGELMSNMYGALEVSAEIRKGKPKKEALNGFMKRVIGAIDN